MGLSAEIEQAIGEAAEAANLPVNLVRAVVITESGGNTAAIRYEPAFFLRYIQGKPLSYVPAGCSRDTEGVGRAHSWGLMQIMGETARCVGFRGWFPELCSPAVGLQWACAYLRRLADKYLADDDWDVVLRAYNGGPGNRHNTANTYPAKVRANAGSLTW